MTDVVECSTVSYTVLLCRTDVAQIHGYLAPNKVLGCYVNICNVSIMVNYNNCGCHPRCSGFKPQQGKHVARLYHQSFI